MSPALDTITAEAIDGQLVGALCVAAGVDVTTVWRIYVDPHGIAFHYYLRNEDGSLHVVGDEAAMGTKRVGIDWTTLDRSTR